MTAREHPLARPYTGPAGAYFSPDRVYRYSLTRDVPELELGCLERDNRVRMMTVVGLNPSTADETTDDPTIRRCVGFARRWGFDRLQVVNLYAFRATDPRELWLADDPVGPENDEVLRMAFCASYRILAAWGVHARRDRLEAFAARFEGHELWTLGLTKDGAPRHPLYVRGDVQPVRFDLPATRLDLDAVLDVPFVFGLRAQGHIPTIKRMLAEGRTWDAIGREIGWDPETAKRHFYVVEAEPNG